MTVYLIAYTIRRYPSLRFPLSKTAFCPSVLRENFRFSLPPAVQSGVSSVGNVYLQSFMNTFGAQTVAAITTAYRVDTVIFLPIINLSSGIATIVAQNIGAGDPGRAKKVFQSGTVIMAAVSLALTGCVLFLGEHLIALFGNMVVAYAEAFSWFFLLGVFLLRYGRRAGKRMGSGA